MRASELSARARQVRVLLRGIEAFGSANSFYGWLHTPCGALGNQMPVFLLTSTEGLAMVDAAMDVLKESIPVAKGTPGGPTSGATPQSEEAAEEESGRRRPMGVCPGKVIWKWRGLDPKPESMKGG